MTSDFGNLGLECGEEWVPFPVTEEMDLRYWAKHTAADTAERYRAAGESANAGRLEKDLRARAADSRTREPLAAFGWYLPGYPEAVAIMELEGIVPDDVFPELTLPLLTQRMSARDLGEPDVREVRLPLGPAVRIRQNIIGDKKSFFGSRPLIRTLLHVVRPEGTEVALGMYVFWREAVVDEPLVEAADAIAQTLEM